MRFNARPDERSSFAVARAYQLPSLLPVASTLIQSKVRRPKVRRASSPAAFWVRKPSKELDRAGDWLLENLSAVRKKSASRAHVG